MTRNREPTTEELNTNHMLTSLLLADESSS